MAIEGLSEQQAKFIKKYLVKVGLLNRKRDKAYNAQLIAAYKTVVDRIATLKGRIASVDDPVLKSLMTGRIDTAESVMARSKDRPDIPGAHRELDEVDHVLTYYGHVVEWKRRSGQLGPRVEDATKKLVRAKAGIAALWKDANEIATLGMSGTIDVNLMSIALAKLDQIEEMIRTGVQEQKVVAQLFENPAGGDDVSTAISRTAAKATLDVEEVNFTSLTDGLAAKFGGTLPTGILAAADEIRTLIADVDKTDPDAMTAAAKQVATKTAALSASADAPLAARQTWLENLATVNARFATLQNHPLAGSDTDVQDRIADIQGDITVASALADAHDYAGATNGITGLVEACSDAIRLADFKSQMTAVMAERKQRLTALEALGDAGHGSFDTALAECQAKMQEAEAAIQDPIDAAVASKALDDVSPMLDDALRLHKTAKKARLYIDIVKQTGVNLRTWQDGLDGGATPLAPDLDHFDTLMADAEAQFAIANESAADRGTGVENAVAVTLGAYKLGQALEKRKANALTYYDELAKQKTRLEKFEGKPGEEAVQQFIGRLKADRRTAEGAAGRNQFHVGAQLLKGSESAEAAMLVQLAAGAAFFPKYKEVETLITAIEGKATDDPSTTVAPDPNKGKVASLLTEAKQLRAEAYSKGVAQNDWGTATTLIEAAKARVQEAGKMIAAFKTLSDEQDSLASKTGDAAAATEAYGRMRTAAQSYAGTDFAEKLREADDHMKAVTDKAEAGTISMAVAAAIALCEEVITLAGKKKAYDAVRAGAAAKHANEVVAKDTPENGISGTRQKIDGLMTDAEQLAKAPGYDFDGATTKIDEALALVNAVPAMLTKRAALAAKMQKVKTLLTKLKGANYVAGCGDSIARLEKIQTDYAAAEGEFDLRKMETIATEADGLIAPLTEEAEAYKVYTSAGYAAVAKAAHDQVLALAPDLSDDEFGERVLIKEKYTNQRHSEARGNYQAAMAAWGPIAWTRDTAVLVAAAWDQYKPVRDATRQALDDLTSAASDTDSLTAAKLDALEKRYEAAAGWASKRRDYVKAKDLMTVIGTDTADLADASDDFKDYNDTLNALDTELAKLDALNTGGTITPVLSRLRNKRTNAVALADADDRPGAKSLLDEAIAEAGKAETDAGALNAFAAEAGALATDAEADDADLAALCDKAKSQVATLVKEMDGVALMPRVMELGDRIAEARAGLPAGADAARAALADVAAKLPVIRNEMAHNDQVLREILAAEKLVAPLVNGHPEARYSAPEAQPMMEKLAAARHQLRSDPAGKDPAMAALEEVLAAYHPLKAATDDHVNYVLIRDQVAPTVEDMETHDNRYAIQDALADFRDRMTRAETRAAAKDHDSAIALVQEARTIQQRAMLKAKMVGNGVPTEDEIRDILAGPNGDKALDEIVTGLDPRATRAVLRVAMTVRFGCTLEMIVTEQVIENGIETQAFEADTDDDAGVAKKGPNIKALYDSMCLLPSADTLSNESLLGVVRVAKPKQASDHHPGTKKMTMREGESADSNGYGVGLIHELEGVPPELMPKPGKPVRGFAWNTLHEVGHAVDDKLNFTNRKGKELAGWEYPSKDVGPFAEVIAKKFKYNKDYVGRLMLKETNPAVPANPDPDRIPPDEWERRRVTVAAWLENTFEGRQPWQTTSAAKACEINGRCYHESMPGYWVSYPIAERAKGVTGYQFRSPLEWFSELYAAYHSDKLADAHPAREWLSKLKNPEEV
ncbi:hypothetical protein [Pseudooceanicola sp.]|uniref:hypothetical protein n=1 Tax=Pseudooceanicola sp. TaxID=1914328 RepID=UPI0035C6AEE0